MIDLSFLPVSCLLYICGSVAEYRNFHTDLRKLLAIEICVVKVMDGTEQDSHFSALFVIIIVTRLW